MLVTTPVPLERSSWDQGRIPDYHLEPGNQPFSGGEFHFCLKSILKWTAPYTASSASLPGNNRPKLSAFVSNHVHFYEDCISSGIRTAGRRGSASLRTSPCNQSEGGCYHGPGQRLLIRVFL